MKTVMGLWIDHREAVLVFFLDQTEEIKHVTSTVEKHVRYSGASESGGSHNSTTEDGRDRRFDDELDRYYDEVISLLHEVTSILILGPGEAKHELQKRLEAHEPHLASITVETADKMTEPQIAAAVRQHFRELQHG
jgi:stalled ribosome rescue protein Dom34